MAKGEFSALDFTEWCFTYLNLNIKNALNHPSPIINSLAILDRRLGKRRLIELDIRKFHPMVRYFTGVRLNAEN